MHPDGEAKAPVPGPVLPWLVRLILWLAARLTPPSARPEWTAGWREELERRRGAGAPAGELGTRALGSVRDALWVRKGLRYSSFAALLRRPFRAEALLVLAAAGVWGLSERAAPPRLPFPNADRIVFLERGIAALGARRPVMSRQLVAQARTVPEFADVSAFQLVWRAAFVRVDQRFFDVLGVRPAAGRTLQPGDAAETAVITHQCWRDTFRMDPEVLGRKVSLDRVEYEIVGVLPDGFVFLSDHIQYFVPLSRFARKAGGAALLRPGARIESAEARFREIALAADPDWGEHGFGLRPAVPRSQSILTLVPMAASLAGVGLAGACLYLLSKGVRRRRYYLSLALRLALAMASLTVIQSSVIGLLGDSRPPTIFHTLFFLLLCSTTVILVVRDHLYRCPVCLERLSMPASLGSWSSVVVDPPAIEYVCPKGHGLLLEEETGEMHSHWTTLDSSWKDLFVKRR